MLGIINFNENRRVKVAQVFVKVCYANCYESNIDQAMIEAHKFKLKFRVYNFIS